MQTALSDLAALVLLLAGLSTGFNLRVHAGTTAPVARHFPGLPTRPPVKPGYRDLVWFVAAAVSVIAVAALAVWNASGAATLILAGCAAILLGAIAWPIHAYGRACARTNDAIESYAPVIAMPYAGSMPIHVGMWAPYVERARHHWCVVARTPELLKELAAKHTIPMVAGTIPDSVRAALYAHESADNGAFLATGGVTHVFLGHGDSDKGLGNPERLLDYDIVAVAGQAAIDRLAAAGVDLPADRIRIVGRPQTEGIRPSRGPMSSIEHQTVLYAPTWRHTDDALNHSSLIVGDRIVKALLDRGITVIFRHHFAGRDHAGAEAMIGTIDDLLERDAAATGLHHLWGNAASTELHLIEAFNLTDAMISDVSGIVVDFMHSQKPIAMYSAQVSTGPDLATEFRADHPSAESAYVIDKDAINIDTILNLMLGPDPLSPSRMRLSAYYLGGEDRPEPAQPFITFVKELGA